MPEQMPENSEPSLSPPSLSLAAGTGTAVPSAVAPILRLHEHRMWVTNRLLVTAETLTDEQLRQSFAIGQGSIWRTLLHLQAAEYVWLKTLGGEEAALFPGDRPGRLPGNQEGDESIESLEDLAARWRKLDAEWRQMLVALTPESLTETVYRVSTSSGHGIRFGTARLDVLLHVCTHAQYTVAQLVNMLRQAGVTSLPDVMLITLARSEAS